MLRRLPILSLLLLLAAAATLPAQDLSLEADQGTWLGATLTGGNLSASSANTLGGWGHLSLGVEARAANPRLSSTSVTSTLYAATARLGLFDGFRLAPWVHGLGSVDLFAKGGRLQVRDHAAETSAIWGLGARLGILRNSIITPAVSLSYSHYSLDELSLRRVILPIGQPERVEFCTNALRLDVSKNLFWITPIAGIGINRNRVESLDDGRAVLRTEEVFYGGVEWNLLLLHLGAEVGRSGGDNFGSVVLRLEL